MVYEVCDFAWVLFRVVRGFSEHVQSYFPKIMYLLHHAAVTKCVSMFATSTGCAAPLSCPRAPTSVTATWKSKHLSSRQLTSSWRSALQLPSGFVPCSHWYSTNTTRGVQSNRGQHASAAIWLCVHDRRLCAAANSNQTKKYFVYQAIRTSMKGLL